jgi:hypothetical protein
VYLRRTDRLVWEYNPYALEVVPFASVSQNDFYTLSVRGMAHYVNSQNVDFTGAPAELQQLPCLALLGLTGLARPYCPAAFVLPDGCCQQHTHTRATVESCL